MRWFVLDQALSPILKIGGHCKVAFLCVSLFTNGGIQTGKRGVRDEKYNTDMQHLFLIICIAGF